jgi:uncharacterized LabA/DUF88 family protein
MKLMPNNQKPSVSVYWDCQNVHINPFLAQYLKIFAESRGELVALKAYANWLQENRISAERLQELKYDCIHVSITKKNSVDEKVINDGEKQLDRDPSSLLILVTGDGDFAPLVRKYKAKGIPVIVFAQSGKESQKLKKLADEFYFVDQLPELFELSEQIAPNTISYSDAIACLIESIQIVMQKGKRATLSYVNQIMGDNSSFPNYQNVSSIRKQDGMTFSRFHKFIEAAMKDGIIGIRLNGDLPELFLVKSSP